MRTIEVPVINCTEQVVVKKECRQGCDDYNYDRTKGPPFMQRQTFIDVTHDDQKRVVGKLCLSTCAGAGKIIGNQPLHKPLSRLKRMLSISV